MRCAWCGPPSTGSAPPASSGLFAMGDAGLAAVTDPHTAPARGPPARPRRAAPCSRPWRANGPCWSRSRRCGPRPRPSAPPRRSAQGVDAGRLALLLAVLDQHADLVLGHTDVFASAVGGIRVTEPAADLALVLALASAMTRLALPTDMVAFGEVGLGGEIRQVPHAPASSVGGGPHRFPLCLRPRLVSRRPRRHRAPAGGDGPRGRRRGPHHRP